MWPLVVGAGALENDPSTDTMARVKQCRLTVVPLTLKQANDGITRWHRHHKAVVGHRFSLGVIDEIGQLRGVLCAGRPVARAFDQNLILEVNRLATDGCPNACSALYGAARKAAQAMGYRRIITYILDSEPGTSLKAAGWVLTSRQAGGGSWNTKKRPRNDMHPLGYKQLWDGWILNERHTDSSARSSVLVACSQTTESLATVYTSSE